MSGEITDEDRRAFKRAELRQMQRLMGEMAAPDPDDEPPPPRRSGCLLWAVLAACCVAVANPPGISTRMPYGSPSRAKRLQVPPRVRT